MGKSKSNPTVEASRLTAVVEKVMHSLVRLLIGRMSLRSLQDILRKAYLREAEDWLKRTAPKKPVTLSRLAVLSGIDARTITKVRNSPEFNANYASSHQFLSELLPETRIIEMWMKNPKYSTWKKGNKHTLPFEGHKASFSELVMQSIEGRGITPKSVLDQLEASDTVRFNPKSKEVTLNSTSYYPFMTLHEVGMLEVGLTTMVSLAETVQQNLLMSKSKKSPLFFQRNSFSHEFSISHLPSIRKEVLKFLKQADESGREVLTALELSQIQPGKVTAGYSMFYFEKNP